MARDRTETWDEYRQRMLDETSRFIEWGLKHPDQVAQIPLKPAGEGGFPASVGRWFWSVVLLDRPEGRLRRWRDRLMRNRFSSADLARRIRNRR